MPTYELYDYSGRLIDTYLIRDQALRNYYQLPNAAYVLERITTTRILALKEEVARAAMEQEASEAVGGSRAVAGGF